MLALVTLIETSSPTMCVYVCVHVCVYVCVQLCMVLMCMLPTWAYTDTCKQPSLVGLAYMFIHTDIL